MPHENESKIIVEDDALDDDLVMPIACCDDYDWEDNDTSYDLENLFGTCSSKHGRLKISSSLNVASPSLGQTLISANIFSNMSSSSNIASPSLGLFIS